MKGVPFSVQQKLMLFNGDKVTLKRFLLSKSPEEREIYQEYLLEKRKQVKFVPIASIGINIAICNIEPFFGFLMLFLQPGVIGYYGNKYEKFETIQSVFNEVDVESKQ
jgi:hypothetical protein